MQKHRMSNPQVFQPPSPYSVGIRTTGGEKVLFLSGQVALDAKGQLVGKGDVEAQTRQVFSNLLSLLSSEGASMKQVVKLTSFLTDASHLPTFTTVRKEFLKEEDVYPASTLVIVKGLAHPDWLVEVEATAVI